MKCVVAAFALWAVIGTATAAATYGLECDTSAEADEGMSSAFVEGWFSRNSLTGRNVDAPRVGAPCHDKAGADCNRYRDHHPQGETGVEGNAVIRPRGFETVAAGDTAHNVLVRLSLMSDRALRFSHAQTMGSGIYALASSNDPDVLSKQVLSVTQTTPRTVDLESWSCRDICLDAAVQSLYWPKKPRMSLQPGASHDTNLKSCMYQHRYPAWWQEFTRWPSCAGETEPPQSDTMW